MEFYHLQIIAIVYRRCCILTWVCKQFWPGYALKSFSPDTFQRSKSSSVIYESDMNTFATSDASASWSLTPEPGSRPSFAFGAVASYLVVWRAGPDYFAGNIEGGK
jgi:hypothetical protein